MNLLACMCALIEKNLLNFNWHIEIGGMFVFLFICFFDWTQTSNHHSQIYIHTVCFFLGFSQFYMVGLFFLFFLIWCFDRILIHWGRIYGWVCVYVCLWFDQPNHHHYYYYYFHSVSLSCCRRTQQFFDDDDDDDDDWINWNRIMNY